MMRFPWQSQQWQQLWHAQEEQRLPHALLFTGIRGTGKTQFAESFVRALLCQERVADTACHHCHACRLIAGKAHPNVLWLEPEKAGQVIKIDQIRSISELIYQTSLQGEQRIVLINPANQMNTHAGNALLKMLEEPPSGAIIILISDQYSRIPATLLSRCQRLTFPPPQFSLALPWLQEQLHALTSKEVIDLELLLRLTQGAPLAAVQWVKTGMLAARFTLYQHLCRRDYSMEMAGSLSEMEVLPFLDFMLTWELDLLRLQLGANVNNIINSDFTQQLIELAKNRRPDMTFLTRLQQLRAQVCMGINMNKQLLIESVLMTSLQR